MANTKIDDNRKPALIVVSNIDNETPVRLWADPATHELLVTASLTVSGLPTAVKDNDAVNANNYGTLSLGTDGSNYQVLSVNSSGYLDVTVKNTSIAVTGTFYPVTQPISIASAQVASGALASGSIATGAIVDALADDAAFTIATSRVFPSGLLADETSTDSVDEGDVGIPRMTLDRKQIAVLSPHATGESLDIFFSIDLDETEEDIKATAGKIYGYYIFNAAAATQYVRFYNATAANTTVGTTAAIIVIPVPAGSAANCAFPQGIGFSTALCAAATTGVAANDTGAPAANSIVIDVFYK